MLRRAPLGLMLGLCLIACVEQRVAPTAGQASAFAEQYLLSQNLDWGAVRKVWPPIEGHPMYGEWWQIDFYGPTVDGRPARVLVDAESGWARQPPPDYAPRLQLGGQTPSHLPPAAVSPGSAIYILAEYAPGSPAMVGLEATIAALNHRAQEDQIPPLFSRRDQRDGTTQLIYGWDGSGGIRPSGVIATWIKNHTGYGAARWVELGAQR